MRKNKLLIFNALGQRISFHFVPFRFVSLTTCCNCHSIACDFVSSSLEGCCSRCSSIVCTLKRCSIMNNTKKYSTDGDWFSVDQSAQSNDKTNNCIPALCGLQIAEIKRGNLKFRRSLLPENSASSPRGVVRIENLDHHDQRFISTAVLAVAFADEVRDIEPTSLVEKGVAVLGGYTIPWELSISSVSYDDSNEYALDLAKVFRQLIIRLPKTS